MNGILMYSIIIQKCYIQRVDAVEIGRQPSFYGMCAVDLNPSLFRTVNEFGCKTFLHTSTTIYLKQNDLFECACLIFIYDYLGLFLTYSRLYDVSFEHVAATSAAAAASATNIIAQHLGNLTLPAN